MYFSHFLIPISFYPSAYVIHGKFCYFSWVLQCFCNYTTTFMKTSLKISLEIRSFITDQLAHIFVFWHSMIFHLVHTVFRVFSVHVPALLVRTCLSTCYKQPLILIGQFMLRHLRLVSWLRPSYRLVSGHSNIYLLFRLICHANICH